MTQVPRDMRHSGAELESLATTSAGLFVCPGGRGKAASCRDRGALTEEPRGLRSNGGSQLLVAFSRGFYISEYPVP